MGSGNYPRYLIGIRRTSWSGAVELKLSLEGIAILWARNRSEISILGI